MCGVQRGSCVVSDFSSGLTISFHTASLTTSHFADTSQHVEWHHRRARNCSPGVFGGGVEAPQRVASP